MSLVEKALKRLTESRGRTEPVARPVVPPASAAPVTPKVGTTHRPRRDLDFPALRASGLLPPDQERKTFSQVYRGIKRPILNRMAQRTESALDAARANVLMVASAAPGDGKTFTAVNLALSFAMERDRHVVLIDGDVVKRELSQRLGFGNDPGLLELLDDATLAVNSYVLQTDLPNLSVLPAGTPSQQATELLSSARMQSLVNQLCVDPDVMVIFDSPPLLLTTESRAIAEIAGQALLVVREGSTTQDMLSRALPLLQACPSVSLILNQSISSSHTYGYGYEYGEQVSAAN